MRFKNTRTYSSKTCTFSFHMDIPRLGTGRRDGSGTFEIPMGRNRSSKIFTARGRSSRKPSGPVTFRPHRTDPWDPVLFPTRLYSPTPRRTEQDESSTGLCLKDRTGGKKIVRGILSSSAPVTNHVLIAPMMIAPINVKWSSMRLTSDTFVKNNNTKKRTRAWD